MTWDLARVDRYLGDFILVIWYNTFIWFTFTPLGGNFYSPTQAILARERPPPQTNTLYYTSSGHLLFPFFLLWLSSIILLAKPNEDAFPLPPRLAITVILSLRKSASEQFYWSGARPPCATLCHHGSRRDLPLVPSAMQWPVCENQHLHFCSFSLLPETEAQVHGLSRRNSQGAKPVLQILIPLLLSWSPPPWNLTGYQWLSFLTSRWLFFFF